MIFLLDFPFYQLLISIYYLIMRINVIIMIFLTFSFLRKKKDDEIIIFEKEMKSKSENNSYEINNKRNLELKAIIFEESEQIEDSRILRKNKIKKDSNSNSSKTEEQIKKIILKILFEEKFVKTSKLLNNKVLEKAAKERIAISEKIINTIINQMNLNKKIEFTQKEGWKIKI